ncbi:MAG: hypothetical protein ABJN36_19330 [Cyclobacteriaceae bacterium]|uniref:hypothetical protein n=1 Tax=Reichenbachiella sp. TaxID=2184521 RepID=UPI003267D48A
MAPLLSLAQTEDPTNYIRTDLISASPTAQEMARYGDVPVTLYAGKTNLSIPIFDCPGTNLSHPISLNYNYSGFKPAQEASWVGLGWNLSVGGVITRTVKDKLDDDPGISTDTLWTIVYDDQGAIEDTIISHHSPNRYESIYDSLIAKANDDSTGNAFLDDAATGSISFTYDTEPDIFNFNMPGYSGRFIILNDQYYFFPHKRFSVTGGVAWGFFEITTDDGVKYKFDVKETTSLRGTAGANYSIPDYHSSYYLSKITHPTGEIIRLTYADDGDVVQYGTRTQTFQKTTATHSSKIFDPKVSYPTDVEDTWRLDSIITDKCIVVFEPGNTRADINGTQKALDAIHIYDHEGSLFKSYEFKTSYFGSGGHTSRYLKLDWVKELGANGNYLGQGYEFEYENEQATFPSATTAAIDHYGYLNGSGSRTGLIPDEYRGQEIGGTTFGVDREPNFTYAKYGALSKVDYPLGGWSEFDYELNTFYLTENQTSYSSDSEYDGLERTNTSTTDVRTSVGKEFFLTHEQEITIYVSRIPKVNPSANSLDDIEIYDYNSESFDPLGSLVYSHDNHPTRNVDTVTTTLPKGKYLFKTVLDGSENNIDISVEYNNEIYVPEPGPGIRIKQITSNPDGGEAITKKFTYEDEYGKPMGLVEGLAYEYRDFSATNDSETKSYTNINSTCGMVHPPSLEIFYNKINEYQLGASDTLKSTYEFTKLESVGSVFNFLGAELKEKRDFSRINGVYKLIKKVENSYLVWTKNTFMAIKPYMQATVDQSWADYYEDFTYEAYSIQSQWYYLNEAIETSYTPDEEPLVSLTQFYHDGTTYLRGKRSLQSDSSEYLWFFKYPEHYQGSTGAIGFVAKNAVTEKRVLKDSLLVGGMITDYLAGNIPLRYFFLETEDPVLDTATLNTWLPTYTQQAPDDSLSNFQDTVTFEYMKSPRIQLEYDPSVHHLTDQYKLPGRSFIVDRTESYPGYENDSLEYESLIWGYEDNYPIARTVNAPSHLTFYTGFEDNSGSVDTNSKTGNKVGSATYSNTLTGLKSGDYLLSYFERVSGVWYRVSKTVTVSGTSYTIDDTYTDSQADAIDDVKFHPVDAQMSTYTYKPLVGLTSSTDPTGRTTFFYYDEWGRFLYSKDQEGNLTQSIEYHY